MDDQKPGGPRMSAPMTFVVNVRAHKRTIKRTPPHTRSTSSPAQVAGSALAATTGIKDKKKTTDAEKTTDAGPSGKKRMKPAKPSTPDSCGKQSDPHDVEAGALARRGGHISSKRRKGLDRRLNEAA
jgi:hypothetical protein